MFLSLRHKHTLSLVIDQQQLRGEYNCIKPFDFGKALNRFTKNLIQIKHQEGGIEQVLPATTSIH
jgi:hypothetical protein